ncbi:hypothetical protein RchiOBHm_Chr1g0369741 [Rosa chinensis]|uniref:Uncharacterized protein n=1 Tax=Rosa chinensis TaxID=74649 RepID=A0A2P6SL29_ROSCH|nr:hypothetical protein RchiOBHm_Chr1g0369741 [Rosa chinensis]
MHFHTSLHCVLLHLLSLLNWQEEQDPQSALIFLGLRIDVKFMFLGCIQVKISWIELIFVSSSHRLNVGSNKEEYAESIDNESVIKEFEVCGTRRVRFINCHSRCVTLNISYQAYHASICLLFCPYFYYLQ